MKKRIGSRNYDTETSEFIASVFGGDLYRKRTRDREYFLLSQSDSGAKILPLLEKEAKAMLGDDVRIDRKLETYVTYIRVDRDTHDIIAKLAKENGLSITKTLKMIISKI